MLKKRFGVKILLLCMLVLFTGVILSYGSSNKLGLIDYPAVSSYMQHIAFCF